MTRIANSRPENKTRISLSPCQNGANRSHMIALLLRSCLVKVFHIKHVHFPMFRFAETSPWSASGCLCVREDPAAVVLHESDMTVRLFSALFQIQTLQTWECLHLCPVGTLSYTTTFFLHLLLSSVVLHSRALKCTF